MVVVGERLTTLNCDGRGQVCSTLTVYDTVAKACTLFELSLNQSSVASASNTSSRRSAVLTQYTLVTDTQTDVFVVLSIAYKSKFDGSSVLVTSL